MGLGLCGLYTSKRAVWPSATMFPGSSPPDGTIRLVGSWMTGGHRKGNFQIISRLRVGSLRRVGCGRVGGWCNGVRISRLAVACPARD